MIPRPFRRLLATALPLAILLAHVGVAPAQTAKKRPSPSPSPKASAKPTASPAATPYVLPDVVATVDGESIKKSELEHATQAVLASGGKSVQDLTPAVQKDTYSAMLNGLILDKLAAKASADEKVDDIEVEDRLRGLRSQYPTPQDFENQIKKNGQTTDEIKGVIRRQLAEEKWLDKGVAESIKVTPQEVEKFYREGSSDRFASPEVIRARHILVQVSKSATPEDTYRAEQKINKMAARIKGGESFEKVAAESDDKTSKDKGGDLDYFSRDKIMPEFGDIAFKLKPGEVSAPVRTQFGYHLIKLEDRKPAHTATLDEARDQIVAYLQAQKRQQATAELVKGLQEKAKIAVFLP